MIGFSKPWHNHGVPWYRRSWEASYRGRDGQVQHVLAYTREGASVRLYRAVRRERRLVVTRGGSS